MPEISRPVEDSARVAGATRELEPLCDYLASLRVFALRKRRPSQHREGLSHVAPIAGTRRERKRLAQHRLRPLVIAFDTGTYAEDHQRAHHTRRVVDASREAQTLFRELSPRLEISL